MIHRSKGLLMWHLLIFNSFQVAFMLANPATHYASIIINLLILTSQHIQSHDPFSSNQRCQLSPQLITVEPEADVTIGAVLPVHAPGEGVYGCGAPTHDGVQVFEAMRWAIDVLNRKSGLISDSSGGSLIPGVKIGNIWEQTLSLFKIKKSVV